MIRPKMGAFIAGFVTLALEILCGRLMAPYFGSSYTEWAALIFVVLASYGFGYESSRWIFRKRPWIPFFASGIYLLLLPIWITSAFNGLTQLPIELAALAGALLSAGPPSLVLASALPYFMKGQPNARILTLSTAGNLLGILFATLVGIPLIGTQGFLLFLAGLCLLLALLTSPIFSNLPAITATIALLILAVMTPAFFPKQTSKVLTWESPYQQIRIRGSGTDNVVLELNGLEQFTWRPMNPVFETTCEQYYNFSAASSFWSEAGASASILSIGIGGGVIPWQISQFNPEAKMTGMELDSVLLEVAAHHLPYGQIHDKMPVHVGDARVLLTKSKESWDFIHHDVFLSSRIPAHLNTKKYFMLIRNHIQPDGLFVANFHQRHARSGLLRRVEKTVASVFPTAAVIPVPFTQVVLIVATPDRIDLRSRIRSFLASTPPALRVFGHAAILALQDLPTPDLGDPEIITDDKNPTELLMLAGTARIERRPTLEFTFLKEPPER
jgi:spermidine synthase